LNGWRVAFGVGRGISRLSGSAGRAAQASHDLRAASGLPSAIARRGWLAPGDPPAPPGYDLLDYSGLVPTASVIASMRGVVGPSLGAVIDLGSGTPGGAYRLALSSFFQHVAVVAPPGKGKTYGVIAPIVTRLLRAGATVVALDVTGDLSAQIKDFAAATGTTGLRVPFFHWSTDAGRGRHSWNPLSGVSANDLTAVEGLKVSILGEKPATPEHRYFHDRELRILGGLLRLTLADREATLADLLGLATDRDKLRGRLASGDRSIAMEMQDFIAADPADAYQMIGEIQTRLAPFAAPPVRALTERSDFTIGDVLTRPSLLVVGAELDLRQRGEIAGALLVNRLAAVLAGRYGRADGAPVVLVLDEAPVLGRRLDLASLLATSRATRTGIVLAAQNVTQMGSEDERSSIFDSCDTMMLLPGASDASIRSFQSRLGRREASRQSTTREFGARRGSVTTSRESVDVLGARELLDPPLGRFPAFVHQRSSRLGPVALELDRPTAVAVDR